MKIFTIFFMVQCLWNCSHQPKGIDIVVYDLNKPEQKAAFEKWVSKNDRGGFNKHYPKDTVYYDGLGLLRFEDERYNIYLAGSIYGGSVAFVNKSNGTKHSIRSSNPIMVEYIDGAYVVTSTYRHMSFSTHILKIKDPEKLTDTTGYEVLLDSSDISSRLSFFTHDGHFLIYEHENNTLLGKIENKKLSVVDTLLNLRTYQYGWLDNSIQNGMYISPIKKEFGTINTDYSEERHEMITGCLYVKGNQIRLGYKHTVSIIKL
ncbi:MAG: hypothetical protein IT270_16280 [Saprospiraceae bacterium]|nr:hypothetical protein [Saprospiraceae bacterium]